MGFEVKKVKKKGGLVLARNVLNTVHCTLVQNITEDRGVLLGSGISDGIGDNGSGSGGIGDGSGSEIGGSSSSGQGGRGGSRGGGRDKKGGGMASKGDGRGSKGGGSRRGSGMVRSSSMGVLTAQEYHKVLIPHIHSQPTQQSIVWVVDTTADIEEAPNVETSDTIEVGEEAQAVDKGKASTSADKGKASTSVEDKLHQKGKEEGRCHIEGVSPLMKCTSAIRQLAYDIVPDFLDEYLQISTKSFSLSLDHFCTSVMEIFGPEYLRKPMMTEVVKLYRHHEEKRGFSGMLGSLDCTDWGWFGCPYEHKGQYVRRDHGPNLFILLKVVASQDLLIWHAFFDVSGSNNDINVLHISSLF
nr:hypothetical protein [Tanacetum cinerariifolium]